MKAGSSIRIYVEVELTEDVPNANIKTYTGAAISLARTELAAMPCQEIKYGFRASNTRRRGRVRRRKVCGFPFPLIDMSSMRKHCRLPEGHEGPHLARDGSELAIVEPLKQ